MRKKLLKSRLEMQPKGKPPLPDNLTDETLLTRGQAAAYAGCSVRTLITWIDEWGLCEVKIGRFSRIRKGELDRFIDGENEETTEELPFRVTGELTIFDSENGETREEPDFTDAGFTEAESYQWFLDAHERVWEEMKLEFPDLDYDTYCKESDELWETEGRFWR